MRTDDLTGQAYVINQQRLRSEFAQLTLYSILQYPETIKGSVNSNNNNNNNNNNARNDTMADN